MYIIYLKEGSTSTSDINKFKEINKNFVPTDIKLGDELFRNGIFVFNITKMIESIENFKGEIIN